MRKLKEDFNWQCYLASSGSATVEIFAKLLNQSDAPEDKCVIEEDCITALCELRRAFCPSENLCRNMASSLDRLNEWMSEFSLIEPGQYSYKTAMESFHASLGEMIGSSSEAKIHQEFCADIELYSTWLSIGMPGFFYPWYFRYSYNMFELIYRELAWQFGFELPEKKPLKSEYLKRFNHYAELCISMSLFAEDNGLSPEEVCAFFYDYAPKTLGGIDAVLYQEEVMPPPHSAFFIGGAEDDIFLSQADPGTTPWQCNPEASPGDIAVMYATTPVSSVTSLWRCVSEGFDDPFFWYYRCTYISNQEQVSPLSLASMKADEVLRELPIVKKNMQGVNGAVISPSQFNYLADLVDAKTPRLEFYTPTTELELTCENDVEEQLIKPVLLAKSGVDENSYRQQWVVPIGNHNERALPRTDFVVFPSTHDGHTTGQVLIEAKYRIQNTQALEDAKQQARGYANLLRCKYAFVASAEGVWVMGHDDDFEEILFETTWGKLEDPDVFSQMAAYLTL